MAPVVTGGLLGLAAGFRGNTLVVVPLIVLIALFRYLPERKGFRNWAVTSSFFLLSFAIVLTPYTIRSIRQDGAPVWFTKIQDVLERSTAESVEDVEGYRQPKLVDPDRERIEAAPANPGLLSYSLNHFVHNEITSVLVFPLSWRSTPLETAVEQPFWDYDQNWQGELTNGEKITLGINLLIISLGIGFAIQHYGVIGLLPLGVHLAYNLTNALSRKSGGRYLVPTEWVVILYFILGIAAIYYVLRGWQPVAKQVDAAAVNRPLVTGAVLAGFLLLGGTFFISDLIPVKIPANKFTNQRAILEEYGQVWMADSGIQMEQVTEFIGTEKGVMRIGLVLYP